MGERKVYYGLVKEESVTAPPSAVVRWLWDTINPHSVAALRANTYTRFTLLSLVRTFLDYANTEFTRDSPESVARASALYKTALDILELPELKKAIRTCEVAADGRDLDVIYEMKPIGNCSAIKGKNKHAGRCLFRLC